MNSHERVIAANGRIRRRLRAASVLRHDCIKTLSSAECAVAMLGADDSEAVLLHSMCCLVLDPFDDLSLNCQVFWSLIPIRLFTGQLQGSQFKIGIQCFHRTFITLVPVNLATSKIERPPELARVIQRCRSTSKETPAQRPSQQPTSMRRQVAHCRAAAYSRYKCERFSLS